jgi:hypothetical protein
MNGSGIWFFAAFVIVVFMLIIPEDIGNQQKNKSDFISVSDTNNLIFIFYRNSIGEVKEYSLDKSLDSNGKLFKIDYYQINNKSTQAQTRIISDWNPFWEKPLKHPAIKDININGRDTTISVPITIQLPDYSLEALYLQEEAQKLLKQKSNK